MLLVLDLTVLMVFDGDGDTGVGEGGVISNSRVTEEFLSASTCNPLCFVVALCLRE